MIIWKNGNITLEYNRYTGQYAIFERVKYMSGTTAFWQQKTKWYYYRKCAENAWQKILDKRAMVC